ncbi:acylneuraminate cytidylyltransferase family protein [Neobacillus sp. D3-1R]|uniref:acylneuraminate cytidylyltransferase family protein n=1 Tax=Neobacillus sp. D3-1R TaxID=3445778 RepID=UPI003FA0E43F
MINGKKVLAVIPARGGSKGIPRKNIITIGGKPLIAWTIEAAKNSKYIDRIILSSEDDEIIKVASEWGCEVPFKRPLELALDDTPGIAPVLHAVENIQGYDYLVLLQPTSPLRITKDIDESIKLCVESNSNSTVSLTESDKSPYWMYTMDENSNLNKILEDDRSAYQRQVLPKTYNLNGAVYVANIQWVLENKILVSSKTIGYVMPKERSIDIDTLFDLRLAEFLIN